MTTLLDKMKDALAHNIYGMTKTEAQSKGVCLRCKERAQPKCYSQAGLKEYNISGLCEECFDKIVGGF